MSIRTPQPGREFQNSNILTSKKTKGAASPTQHCVFSLSKTTAQPITLHWEAAPKHMFKNITSCQHNYKRQLNSVRLAKSI